MGYALVQTVENNADAASATIAVTINGVVAGNLLVVCVAGYNYTDADVSGVADDQSTAAVKAADKSSSTANNNCEIWYFQNHGGGNRTVTATFTTSNAQYRYITVSEWSGGAITSVFEGKAINDGTSATPSTGNLDVTPSQDGMLIIGLIHPNAVPTAAAPFTLLRYDGGSTNAHSEYYIQPTAAAIAATWTMSSATFGAVAASFKVPATVSPDLQFPRGLGRGLRRGLSHSMTMVNGLWRPRRLIVPVGLALQGA
jgi:hypothetical protein